MENRKGVMPGTRPTKRASAAFPVNGDFHGKRSGKRTAALREGRSEQHTLTRGERKQKAHDRVTSGSAGFHGQKRGRDVLSSRPRSSTPTRHQGRDFRNKHQGKA